MLIKIKQLEETCEELEDEVDEFKQKIMRMLKAEQQKKKNGQMGHVEKISSLIEQN